MISLLLLTYLSTTVTITVGDNCPPKSNAVYRQDTKTILVCEDDPALQEDAIVHELGHHLYFHYLTQKQRELWHRVHQGCKKDACFISEYAQKNPTEDFAVTFEAIYNGRMCANKFCRAKMMFTNGIIENTLSDIEDLRQ